MKTQTKNPIHIYLDNTITVLKDKSYPKDVKLTTGIIFDTEHYGFTITRKCENNDFTCYYPTQCPIESVCMDNGYLTIYEKHKTIGWRFNPNNGYIKQKAYFLDIIDDDIKYLESIGITEKKEIEKINSYFR